VKNYLSPSRHVCVKRDFSSRKKLKLNSEMNPLQRSPMQERSPLTTDGHWVLTQWRKVH